MISLGGVFGGGVRVDMLAHRSVMKAVLVERGLGGTQKDFRTDGR
jgi:hypothetical protein